MRAHRKSPPRVCLIWRAMCASRVDHHRPREASEERGERMSLWLDALAWAALGLLLGWLANSMTRSGLGLALMMLVGVLGALLGGLALSLAAPGLFYGSLFTPVGLLAALGGSLLFLLIARLVTGRAGNHTSP
jgi:uncharacterized membrane protein YeaQ/YmgE (transglycosylase-associated protein family)